MPITHPSMRKAKANQSSQPKQEFHVVEDATNEPMPVIPDHILNPQPMPKPDPIKKEALHSDMLEELLFLGRTIKEVKIGTMVFEVSTLTQKETSELMRILYSDRVDAADLFAIRALTLSYAVKSVNGTPLEDIVVENDEYESVESKREDILVNMQKHVVEKLHEAYLDLVAESEKLFEDEEVKEELKNS